MNNKKRIVSFVGALLLAGVVLAGYQNCGEPMAVDGSLVAGKATGLSSNGATAPLDGDSDSLLNNGGNGGGNGNVAATPTPSPTPAVDPNAPKWIAMTSADAKTNCSLPTATWSAQMYDADVDIRWCAEFSLVAPAGTSNYNRSNVCDVDSKFAPPDNLWEYSARNRSWTLKSGLTVPLFATLPFISPGTYRTVVKTRDGKIYKSPDWVVGRPGYTDCDPNHGPLGQSTAPRCAYEYNGAVFGGTVAPTGCSAANVGSQVSSGGYLWTCVCK